MGGTVVHIECKANLGFAKGNNIGALYAKKVHANYVLFSNNDIKFLEKISLKKVANSFIKMDKTFIVGPRIVSEDGICSGPYYKPHIFSYLFLQQIDLAFQRIFNKNKNKSGFYYSVHGCFFFVDLHRFCDVGMFDEHTFLYREEEILSARGLLKGYNVYYTDAFKVIHEGSGTIKNNVDVIKIKKQMFSSAVYYFSTYRNASWVTIGLAKLCFEYIYIPFYLVTKDGWELVKKYRKLIV